MTFLRPPSLPWRPAAVLLLTGLLGGCASTDRSASANIAEAQTRASAALVGAAGEPAARPDTQATYLALVRQMQQGGLWFASLAHIDALEKQWGTSPDSLLLRGHALRQTGKDAEAVVIYRRLTGTPLEGAGLHGQGLVAGMQGNFLEASRFLEEARQLAPTDGVLLSDLGYAQLRAGQQAAARIPLMQAAQLQPDDARIQANLALYLLVDGQSAEAQLLMDSRRMPTALRSALVQQASRIDPSIRSAPPTAHAVAEASQTQDTPPLALRPSWTLAVPSTR